MFSTCKKRPWRFDIRETISLAVSKFYRGEHPNSWDLWMFISNLVTTGFDPCPKRPLQLHPRFHPAAVSIPLHFAPEVHTTTTKEKQKWVVRSCFDRFLASRWVWRATAKGSFHLGQFSCVFHCILCSAKQLWTFVDVPSSIISYSRCALPVYVASCNAGDWVRKMDWFRWSICKAPKPQMSTILNDG